MPFLGGRSSVAKGFFGQISLPSITINAVTNFNQSIATFNATLDSTGGATTTVTFEWKKTSDPDSSYASVASTAGTGSTYYRNHNTGLDPGTGYTVRAKATNAAGTVTSTTTTFTTWSEFIYLKTSANTYYATIPTVTPTGGSAVTATIRDIELISGGGGSGWASGGGGGQHKSAATANVTGQLTVVVGGGGAYLGTGGTSSITGTNITLSSPGGTPGKDGYGAPTGTYSPYARTEDGGASADNNNVYIGGTGYYWITNENAKDYNFAGGGGAGAGGDGGNGTTSGSPGNYIGNGGNGGPVKNVYGLSGGQGGAGNGSNGTDGTQSSGYGAGGNGTDPNYPFNTGSPGNDGAVRFKYYAAAALP